MMTTIQPREVVLSQSSEKTATTGRREEKKRANRKAILDAATEVFARLGYDAAVTRDIVRASGLSPGTFYNYFKDKEEVFTVLMTDLIQELSHRVHEARERAISPYGFLEDAFISFFSMFLDDRPRLELIARNQAVLRTKVLGGDLATGLFHELESDLEKAMSAGMLPRVPIQMIVWSMTGASFEILARYAAHPPENMDPREPARFLARLFLGGLEKLAGD